jgi:hypothetical protein
VQVRLFGWPSVLVSEKRASALHTSYSNRTFLATSSFRSALPVQARRNTTPPFKPRCTPFNSYFPNSPSFAFSLVTRIAMTAPVQPSRRFPFGLGTQLACFQILPKNKPETLAFQTLRFSISSSLFVFKLLRTHGREESKVKGSLRGLKAEISPLEFESATSGSPITVRRKPSYGAYQNCRLTCTCADTGLPFFLAGS